MAGRRQKIGLVGVTALALLAGCSGGSTGQIGAIPFPPLNPNPVPPTPTPTPPATDFDTAEYQRSNAATSAQAIAAYRAGATGAGVIAAIIDSGVDSSSPEFVGRISSMSRDVAGSRSIDDEDGHGTEIAGILLAAKNNSGIHGVAFGATLLALRADRPGSCAETDGCGFSNTAIAAGFDVATSARARVINVSLGGGAASEALNAAVNRATSNGAVVVVSAGNDSSPSVDPLAAAMLAAAAPGTVIIAGSLDANNTIPDFSNRAGDAVRRQQHEAFREQLGAEVGPLRRRAGRRHLAEADPAVRLAAQLGAMGDDVAIDLRHPLRV